MVIQKLLFVALTCTIDKKQVLTIYPRGVHLYSVFVLTPMLNGLLQYKNTCVSLNLSMLIDQNG